MDLNYSIKVYKQYFNFACSHFLIFENGDREPLHGHNYRVLVKGEAGILKEDLVFDFLDIKPIVREVCDSLDHKLLIPKENDNLKIFEEGNNFVLQLKDGFLSIPQKDIQLLPIHNTSAERLAIYINEEVRRLTFERFDYKFATLEIEVEETPGQSAVFIHKEEL